MKTTTPTGLQTRGRRFWRTITKSYELSAPELELLLETARTLDLVERLEARVQTDDARAIAEIRQQRITLGRLLAQLAIPAPTGIESPRTLRARKAAGSRWEGHVRRAEA